MGATEVTDQPVASRQTRPPMHPGATVSTTSESNKGEKRVGGTTDQNVQIIDLTGDDSAPPPPKKRKTEGKASAKPPNGTVNDEKRLRTYCKKPSKKYLEKLDRALTQRSPLLLF